MGDALEVNRCDNCGEAIVRDYSRKLPRWFHRRTSSAYCEMPPAERWPSDQPEAEPRD